MTSSNGVSDRQLFKDKNGNEVRVGDTVRILEGNIDTLSPFEAEVIYSGYRWGDLSILVIIPDGVLFMEDMEDASGLEWHFWTAEHKYHVELVSFDTAITEPSEDIYNDLI